MSRRLKNVIDLGQIQTNAREMTRTLPAIIRRHITVSRLPQNYLDAKAALSQLCKIDECKEWVNQSEAMVSYARQSRDVSMIEKAVRIRTRAQERLGEMLSLLPSFGRGPGGRGKTAREDYEPPASPRSTAERELGISDSKSRTYVRAASVPVDVRDRLIEASPPATISQLAALGVTRRWQKKDSSPAFVTLMGIGGLGSFLKFTEENTPGPLASQLTKDESIRIRVFYLQKISIWIDELDRRLPK